MKTAFPKFRAELSEHPGGYHRSEGPADRTLTLEAFSQRSIACLPAYLDFLAEIGPGSYFSGGLVIFNVEPAGLVDQITKKLEGDAQACFAIGYDGTTDGFYCLNRSGTDETVYWYESGTKEIDPHHSRFLVWIEGAPAELFNQSVYAGYKKIKNIEGIRRVVEERRRFNINLLKYDKQLVRPPNKEKQFLPRYHRIVFELKKNSESKLTQLTFRVRRNGSSVGADNVQYVTIDLPTLAVGGSTTIDAYVFDPFNLPFKDLVIEFDPEIDLGSSTRSHFAELKLYL